LGSALCLSVPDTGRRAAPAPEADADATTQTDAELARLTGELAHEIKNPLSTIKVNLKLTREALDEVGNLDSRQPLSEHHQSQLGSATRKITIVQKEADRLEQILDGFLGYVRR